MAPFSLQAAADTQATVVAEPDSWVDSATGHKIIKISRLAGSSEGFQTTQNAFTATGDKMVFINSTTDGKRWLYSLDITSGTNLGSGKLAPIAELPPSSVSPVVAPLRREVYYFDGARIVATNLDSLKTRVIIKVPLDWETVRDSLGGLSINYDETWLVGKETFGVKKIGLDNFSSEKKRLNTLYRAHLKSLIFSVDLKTNQMYTLASSSDWFDHPKFSPTDIHLVEFDHQGPSDLIDRMWTVRTDGSGLASLHPREQDGELYGNDFWSHDGKTIWFDYRKSNSKNDSFLVGQNLATRAITKYSLSDHWSFHYNASPDGKAFVCDGSNKKRRIFLMVPGANESMDFRPLVDMSKNKYGKQSPNAVFSPDGKWVIYTSSASGVYQVYAVEVAGKGV